MIKKYSFKTLLLLSTILLLASCKKNYTCTCTDSSTGTKSVVFSEKTTEGKAHSKCDEYYNSHYGAVPFNTYSCGLD